MPEGLDHQVDVQDDTVLRRSLSGDGLAVADESELLRLLQGRVSLPVPRVLRTWPARGHMEMSLIPGSPLLGHLAELRPRAAERLAGVLGDFVASVATIPTDGVAHLVPLDPPQPDQLLAEATQADLCVDGRHGPGACGHEAAARGLPGHRPTLRRDTGSAARPR